MKIALFNKDMLASILKNGEIKTPHYLCADIVVSEEDALRKILLSGNPIEYPEEYLIVKYDSSGEDNTINICSIKELIATNTEGMRSFKSQFREDLIISQERYCHIFGNYLDNEFQQINIQKGIKAFRSLCNLETSDELLNESAVILRGLKARLDYEYHYKLPIECYKDPYLLMITYDCHAPYPSGWKKTMCEVIETFVYHKKPDLGYREMPIADTDIYKNYVKNYDKKFLELVELIKDTNFVKQANDFFWKPGGYLVPFVFYYFRDLFRNNDSFFHNKQDLIKFKSKVPEAFDTASTFIGGFFGYKTFYNDYYSSLDLPIFRKQPCNKTEHCSINNETNTQDSEQPKPSIKIDLYNHILNVIEITEIPINKKKKLKEIIYSYKDNIDKLQVIDSFILKVSPDDKNDESSIKKFLNENFGISDIRNYTTIFFKAYKNTPKS